MKKRITIITAVLALLTLSAASTAQAVSSGVLVRQGDGYLITGMLRDSDGQLVTIHGTLTEQTTGFNSCPFIGTASALCFPEPPGGWTCNLLGGDVTLNFQGTIYDAAVNISPDFHFASALCRNADNPTTYGLGLYLWSTSHVPPGNFPDIFSLGALVQQITPKVFKW
jgi:hypothetical protein